MNISYLTAPSYYPAHFDVGSVRRRGIFYATKTSRAGFVHASMGLIENLSAPGRHATLHSVPRGPVLLPSEEGNPSSRFLRHNLVKCFSQLFEHAEAEQAAEVVVPVHGWVGPLFSATSEVVPWGYAAEALSDVLRDSAGAFSKPVLLVSQPQSILRRNSDIAARALQASSNDEF